MKNIFLECNYELQISVLNNEVLFLNYNEMKQNSIFAYCFVVYHINQIECCS